MVIAGEERTYHTVKFPLVDEAGEVNAVAWTLPRRFR